MMGNLMLIRETDNDTSCSSIIQKKKKNLDATCIM